MERYSLWDKYNEDKKKADETESSRYSLLERYKQNQSYEHTDTSSVDQKYIDSFINDSNAFLTTAEKEYGGLGWGTASSAYESRNTTWQDLNARADIISAWLYKNRNNLDQEAYSNFSTSLEDIRRGGSSVLDAFKNSADYYAQWDTEDAYNAWKTEYDRQEAEKQAILGASDFKQYSDIGANIENPTYAEAEGWFSLGPWHPFGKDIGNIVTFSRDNIDSITTAISMSDSNAAISNVLGDYRYQYLEDDEVSIYNYYLGKGDTKKAAEYLSSLDDTLNQRWAGEIANRVSGNPFDEGLFAVGAGLDQFASGVRNIDNLIMGTEADPTTVTQYANSTIRENIGGGVGGVAYDLVQTTAHMLPSILVGSVAGSIAGTATLGVSAAGNGYAEMRNLGYNEGQSRAYGLLVGASEAILQEAIGGIGALGGKVTGNVVSKLVSKIDNALARLAIKLGGKILSEGLEESVQEVLDPVFKWAVTLGEEEFEGIDWEQVVYSGLLGVLSAGVLEGVPTIAGTVDSNYKTNVQMGGLSNKGAVNAFFKGNENGTKGFKGVYEAYKSGKQNVNEAAGHYTNEALEIDSDNAHAQRMQARLDKGKNVSGYQINRLVEANEQALNTQDKAKMKSAVEARLTELGESGDIGKLADIIVKAQSGGKLTSSERSALVNSKYGRRVSTELNPQSIESGEYTSKWAENLGTERINVEAYNRELYKLAEEQAGIVPNTDGKATLSESAINRANALGQQARTVPVTENAPAKEIPTEGEFKASETGKTIYNGSEVKIQRVASTKNREVMVQLDNGEVVSARAVEFSSQEEALIYEAVADMDVDTANDFIQGFNSMKNAHMANPQSFSDYQLGFKEAQTYGELGIPFEAMLRDGEHYKALVGNQAQIAYNRGRINGVNKAASAKKVAQGQKNSPNKYEGETHISEINKKSQAYKSLNDTQKAGIAGITAIYKALGIDVYFFESPVDSKGKRQGKNGYFNPEDNSVHLDLYAGFAGEGLILFTGGHELTHYIRENLPEKFKTFADLLFEQYEASGTSVATLIERKKKKLIENKRITPDMTDAEQYDLAYEEVVADACEAMLGNGEAFAMLSEKVKAKDKGLWNAIKKFFTDLVARIKSAYENLAPDSVEGQKVAKMLETATDLQRTWVDMLVEASDVSEVIETDAKPISNDEIITDGAVVTDGKGNKYSIRSMKHDISDGQMFRDLMTYCDFTKEQVGELRHQLEELVDYMIPHRDIVDLNETYDREGRRYSPYKPNSDPLYTISLDFSTQCSKRLLTQYVIEQLQLRENRPMSAEEQMAIRDMLIEYGKVEKGLQVSCVMCYVEAARLKAPKQIQKWLDDPSTAMRNFFADKNPEFSAYIKEKQADFKESRGYDRNATKKDMVAKDVKALNQIRPRLRSQYNPSVEEMAIIETASSLPNSTYLTAGNLADLSETHPEIYKAYTAFIRTATRSKALETDEPYYYGDSTRDNGNGIIVSDSFIESVNRENGMRYSSWSDWRIQHLLDWITAVIDNSVRGAAMHGYTKYGDEVRVLGKTGMMFNMSGVTGTQTGLNEDGSLNFSETESMDYDEAIKLREEFPETAGLQCIGVGVDHIYALLRSDVIDYVIPYHTSGLNATLRRMGKIYGWKDFTQTQHATEDKSIKKENAVDPDNWHKEPVFSEFFVGYDTGLGGVEAMQKSAENYKRMCKERGLKPKFLEFANEPNYWKLLIDRKMVNQKTNTLIQQKAVTPTFDFGVIKGIVDKYVANYDSGLEQRAFNHIVENWDNIPKRIRDLKKQGGTKAKKTKKAVDTLANQTVAVQPKGVKNSDRDTNAPTFYSYMGRVVDDIKSNKIGAGDVVSYLKGKGVKAEEIKWSGIEAWLDGKKSVTKAELQEFVAGSQLVIEEDILDNEDRPYTEDQKKRLGEYQAKQDEVTKRVADEWKKITGKDLPINIRSAATESGVVNAIIDANKEHKDASFEGRLLKKLDNDIREVIDNNDYFGFDSVDDALLSIHRHRKDFIKNIDASTNDKAVIVKYCNALNAYNELPNLISDKDTDRLRAIAREGDQHGRKIAEVMREYDEEQELHMTKWDQYTLEGGKNYRELLFKLPDSTYSNNAMYAHWDERSGVLAHARVQDFDVNGKNMLFIEELQSDWHNEGAKAGYEGSVPDAPFKNTYHEYVLKRLIRMAAEEGYDSIGWTPSEIQTKRWSKEFAEAYRIEYDQDIPKFLRKYGKKWGATVGKTELLTEEGGKPYYDEHFDEVYASVDEWKKQRLDFMRKEMGWPKSMLSNLVFEEEGDSVVLRDKTNGAEYGTLINQGSYSSVWSMDIPSSMKDSVLHEGQVMYSDRDNVGYHAGDLGKAEYYYQQGYSRGTGHFGTGTYFVGEEEKISGDNTYGKRPHHAVDFSDYNLYKIKDDEDGWKLHDQLRVIDGGLRQDFYEKALDDEFRFYPYVSVYDLATKKYKTESNTWEEAYIPAWKDIANERGIEYQSEEEWSKETNVPTDDEWFADYYSEYLKKTTEEATEAVEKEYRRFRDAYFHLWLRFGSANTRRAIQKTIFYQQSISPDGKRDYFAERDKKADSLATVFMKALGYEGIDVRGTRLDNVEYGSVIYDLKEDTILYQDRDPSSVSNRSLLANALESVAQNDIERNKLAEYKSKIALIESEQAKLAETKAKIKELSFATGRRDTEAIKKLQFEANQSANRINTYDRQLLNLEATAALKGVLQREKQLAYKKAEREGREALAKYREKAANTQRELLTRYQESRKKGVEGRKKTEMRHKIKKVVSDLNKLLNHGTKDRNVKEELRETVASSLKLAEMLFSDDIRNEDIVRLGVDSVTEKESLLLAEYSVLLDTIESLQGDREYLGGMEKVSEELLTKIGSVEEQIAKAKNRISYLNRQLSDLFERERARLNKATASQLMGNLADEYLKLKTSETDYIRAAFDDYLYARLNVLKESIGGTIARDMSIEQLQEVYDAYKMVEHSVRDANKAFKAAKGETISTIANGVIAELDAQKKSPKVIKGTDNFSAFSWNNLKPVYAFERIGSANFTKVFNAVRAGEDVWARDMSDAEAFRKAQEKKHNYKSFNFDKQYDFVSSTGLKFSLNLGQIMSLYAYSKRGDQAKEHLKYGGFQFDGLTEIKEKKGKIFNITYQLKDTTTYKLSDELLNEITGVLDTVKGAKDFVDEMQDYLSTIMGEKGNEVSLELYGVKLFKEENYFPLRSSKDFLERAREQAMGDVKIKNSGFSQATVPKARNTIVLSSFMDVWAGHVNDMSMYHAFVLPLEDFYRVFNYGTPVDEKLDTISVVSSLRGAHRAASVQYIDQLLKDLNGGARSDPRETLGKSMMSNFKKAAVMASWSVVVQQPTAIVRATAVVDAKYFFGKPLKQKHKDAWAEVKKYAPVAVIKEMGYFDTGMGKGSVEWLKGEKTFMDKVDDATSKLPALADEITWVAIWNAVKRETVHKYKHLAPNSDAFLQVVGERFTEVITKTQVYDSTLSRSANMRSKGVFMNMVTSFMAEPTTSINMIQDAFRKGNKKYIARALAAVYGSVLLNSALVSIVYAMRDDDEDETFLEKYLSRFTTEMIDGINPLTYIPFVKDIWSIAQGFDVERADMSLITDLFDSFQQMTNVISKDTSDMDEDELAEHKKDVWASVLGITDTISSILGVPVKNVRRDINGAINFFKTIGTDMDGRKTTANSLGDVIINDVKDSIPVWGWLPDESKADKLYDAIIKGDADYVDRLKSGYKTEESYHSAVKKTVREHLADGELTAYEAERILVKHSDLSEEEASSKVQYWEFKMDYPDYDLSEEAVAKYYTDVEPYGISMDVYLGYYERKASCKGWDDDGDGRADSGSKKAEIMEVIDSLPITDEQKDALYYLNGWSASTIREAPWH